MKRTVPLLITAAVGFVLICASFIPATEDWGEKALIWFDILAAIAFILGGGNLLLTQLKKISDRVPGWGYAVVTLVAFLITLFAGLLKLGSQPAVDTEYYGETFAPLPLSEFPASQLARVEGTIPEKASGEPLPLSVRRQLRTEGSDLVFDGWMTPNQMQDLLDYNTTLLWQCRVEQLAEKASPPGPLKGKVVYYADHDSLAFCGPMTDEDRALLLSMATEQANPAWIAAVTSIGQRSRQFEELVVDTVPAGFEVPPSLSDVLSYSPQSRTLRFQGPMSRDQLEDLMHQFPPGRPMRGPRRAAFVRELESLGPSLNEDQLGELNKLLEGPWTTRELQLALDTAGKAVPETKSACELLEEMQSGVAVLDPQKPAGESVALNDSQTTLLETFVDDPAMSVEALAQRLKEDGAFNDRQRAALFTFFERTPTVGEWNRDLAFALMSFGPLNRAQREFLFQPYRAERAWRAEIVQLFSMAHDTKYAWSGEYGTGGSLFWWLYEYALKPLTATMFAMLAFYVASAAFRAFRIKNLEAFLLLGTAFIVLLGRTPLGAQLTSWIPPEFAGLRFENVTDTIMQVFNTAGNRAIMIGIALGVASTSLKVLLGLDRSYLGGREE